MNARAVNAKVLAPKPKYRDLKYKLLGSPAPARTPDRYVAPASWTELDTLQYLKQTRVLAQSAIALLVKASDLKSPAALPPPVRTELKHPSVLSAVLSTDAATFGKTLTQVTAYDYGAKATAQISSFLHYMLRPGNTLQLTPGMYNAAVGFFLSTGDVQMAQLLLHQMHVRGVPSTAVTYNLFLKSLAQRISAHPYPLEGLGHPLLMVLALLRRMLHSGVKADTETWNLALQCMPFGFGKSFMVEEMDRRDIPLSPQSQRVCLQTIISDRHKGGLSPHIYEAVVSSIDRGNPHVFRLLIDNVLAQKQPNNANVLRAWHLLKTTRPVDVSTTTLNVFLKRFAQRRHLDWQLGVLGHFEATPWNEHSWEYLIECATFAFYDRPERYALIGTILNQAEREEVPLTARARYCARRALRNAAAGGSKLLDWGPAGWESLKTHLRWGDSAMQPLSPEYLGSIGFSSQAGPAMSTAPADLDCSRFEPFPRTDSAARLDVLRAALKSSDGVVAAQAPSSSNVI